MQKINVEKYNPQWQVEFERAKLFYEKLLVGIDKRWCYNKLLDTDVSFSIKY